MFFGRSYEQQTDVGRPNLELNSNGEDTCQDAGFKPQPRQWINGFMLKHDLL